MARLPIGLAEVGCRKPSCKSSSDTLHRHHKRHQAMWFGVWAKRRTGDPEWKAFMHRYYLFLAEDIVLLCADHHAEIHKIYDKIIQWHKKRAKKPLYRYTWREANDLMDRLERACLEWLEFETPGYSHEKLSKERARRFNRYH